MRNFDSKDTPQGQKKTVASLLKRRKLLRLKAECPKKILSLSEKTTALTVFKKILILDLS